MSAVQWLIIGLGNPGSTYAGHRHNVGYMVVDVLAQRDGLRLSAHRSRASVAEARLGVLPGGRPGPRVILAKPSTYMNVSGGPAASLSQYFRIPAENILVIHDEVDIPFGTLRLKSGGGEGGHNGLRDISSALGTRAYHRVRVGVGRPPGQMSTADFVLSNFTATEAQELPDVLTRAVEAIEMIVREGLLAAQGKFHQNPTPGL